MTWPMRSPTANPGHSDRPNRMRIAVPIPGVSSIGLIMRSVSAIANDAMDASSVTTAMAAASVHHRRERN